MIDISIIIVSWNVKDRLKEALTSIYANQDKLKIEVFVSDNASKDDTAQMVRHDFPQTRFIQNEGNIGFTKANNRAYKYARGKYIFFLNPDTVLKPKALTELAAFMDKHTNCGAVGPRLLNADETLQASCKTFPTIQTQLFSTLFLDAIFPQSTLFGKHMMTYWKHNDIREVDQIMGAAMLCRKETLDQVGIFDEKIIFWYDEVDLCYRIKKTGWKVFFTPLSQIIHYQGTSFRQWKSLGSSLRGAYIWRKSRNYFFKKHYGFWQVPIIMLFDLAQIAMILSLLYLIFDVLLILIQTVI